MASGKITFEGLLLKFDKKGEKSGWTYIEIDAELAQRLVPGNKKSFRVKGLIDHHKIEKVAVLPMGNGEFIIPINGAIRKAIGRTHGAMVKVVLAVDNSAFQTDSDFEECLQQSKIASEFFKSLTPSHQRYFSKWISDAKTMETKANRIAKTISALEKRMHYGQMLQAAKRINKGNE